MSKKKERDFDCLDNSEKCCEKVDQFNCQTSESPVFLEAQFLEFCVRRSLELENYWRKSRLVIGEVELGQSKRSIVSSFPPHKIVMGIMSFMSPNFGSFSNAIGSETIQG